MDIERNKSLSKQYFDRLHYLLGESASDYRYPIIPRQGEKLRFWKDSPAHKGPFKHAVDIIVPDPRITPISVKAPASGKLIELVQGNSQWGDNQEFNKYLNYLTVLLPNNREFYQFCHVGMNSCLYSLGDYIEEGNEIATTGANGWMMDVRHIHFMVGLMLPGKGAGFRSLKIRWKN